MYPRFAPSVTMLAAAAALVGCPRPTAPLPEVPPGALPEASDGGVAAASEPEPPKTAPSGPIRVLVGGDVTLGYHYEELFDAEVAKGKTRDEMFAHGFSKVSALGKAADLFVVNLECPFTARGEKIPKNFNFRARPELVSALQAGHVGAVSLANNHLMDYGEVGLYDTLAVLDEAGIPHFGAGRSLAEARRPAIVTVGGVRLAFLGYFFLGNHNIEPPVVFATETTAGVAGHFDDEDFMERIVVEDVRLAKTLADVVVPFFHWGREGRAELQPYQLRLGHAAIDAGAAAVFGSHPHVLQGMELYQGAPVLYSLGNFVFGGNWNPRDKRSALVSVRFSPAGYLSSEVIPLKTDRYPEVPIQPYPLEGEEAQGVLRYLAEISAPLGRTLPELEPFRTLEVSSPSSP
jgi:poly-gamma-glutamate synthesis protein (capsule biosynthesis protein)